MSDIKDIIPEKDWKKVTIQDYPATPTPQNVPSEYFFNGMSKAIKELMNNFSIEQIKPTITSDFDVIDEVHVFRMGILIGFNGRLTNTVSGKVMFTLPPSMRPSRTTIITGGGSNGAGNVQVNPNGTVMRWGTGDLFLAGINFIIM